MKNVKPKLNQSPQRHRIWPAIAVAIALAFACVFGLQRIQPVSAAQDDSLHSAEEAQAGRDGVNTTLETYTIYTSTAGSGLGRIDVVPNLPAYAYGDIVLFTAVPAPGSTFEFWSGDLSSTNSTETLSITKDSAVTATFALAPVRLDLFTDGDGSGQVSIQPPGPLYTVSEVITLTAAPDELSALVGWDGAISGSGLTKTLTIVENSVVTATFERVLFLLDLATTMGGSVSRTPNQPNYAKEAVVSVVATPEVGWSFDAWSGDLLGAPSSLSLVMTRDISSTATFTRNLYTIETATIGSGTIVRTPKQARYIYGDQVDIEAVANPGWIFGRWHGDLSGDQPRQNVIVEENLSITAEFLRVHTVDINRIGQGAIALSPDKPYYFPGEEIEVSAIPDPGWVFSGWSGDVDSTEKQITLTVNRDLHLTATFKQLFSLSIGIQGGGLVEASPRDQTIFIDGEKVKLRAFPDPGWSFAGWRGDVVDGATLIEILMNKDTSVTARFAQDIYGLHVIADGNGTVTTDPPGPYIYGEVVALIAISAWDWQFVGWSQSIEYDPSQIISTDPVEIVSVTEEATYVAHFVQRPWHIFFPRVFR